MSADLILPDDDQSNREGEGRICVSPIPLEAFGCDTCGASFTHSLDAGHGPELQFIVPIDIGGQKVTSSGFVRSGPDGVFRPLATCEGVRDSACALYTHRLIDNEGAFSPRLPSGR